MLLAALTPPWPVVLAMLEFPVVMALLDCWQRPEEHFAGGAPDRKAWIRWLLVAAVTVPILLGFGIVLGYYYAVVRRNSPASGG
jgi:hypothetical protein